MLKNYIVLVSSGAVRDMQVARNSIFDTSNYLDDEDLDYSDWNSDLFLDIFASNGELEELIEGIENVAHNNGLSPENLSIMEANSFDHNLKTIDYNSLKTSDQELPFGGKLENTIYSLGVILGNADDLDEEIVSSVEMILQNLRVDYNHPTLVRAYANCFPLEDITKQQAEKELQTKLSYLE